MLSHVVVNPCHPCPKVSAMLRDYYELSDRGDENDLTGVVGFLMAVRLILQVVVCGLVFGGHPCSSFVWISSATTGRSANTPVGNQSKTTLYGNLLLSRWILLCMLATCRNVYWLTEQPGSSVMRFFPRMAKLLQGVPSAVVRLSWPR